MSLYYVHKWQELYNMVLNILLYNVLTEQSQSSQGHYLGRGANVTMSTTITYISKKHGIYLSLLSLDGVYMGATVWRQDKVWFCCFTVVYQMNMWNKHTAKHLYKQLTTFIIVPQGSLGFTANNAEGRKDLGHHLMHLKWNCCYNVVSICKLSPVAMAAQRIRQQTYGTKSGEQPGYCTTFPPALPENILNTVHWVASSINMTAFSTSSRYFSPDTERKWYCRNDL